MIIGCVIPTLNERPLLTAFIVDRLKKQTRKPDITAFIDYPNHNGSPDIARRYKEGIRYLIRKKVDFIVFIEDDDYYPVTYIEEMTDLWKASGKPPLIGNKTTVYYHIFKKKYLRIQQKHCSAYCTAVAPNVMYDVCGDFEAYYDVKLWRENKGIQVDLKNMPIGIKHGIGRCGGGGHFNDRWYTTNDPNYEFLRSAVDAEAFNFYKSLL